MSSMQAYLDRVPVVDVAAQAPTTSAMVEAARVDLELAEEAFACAAFLVADAVALGVGDVDLLVGEYLRARAAADLKLAIFEAAGLDSVAGSASCASA